ncbi:MAG: hypothetical protein K1060chlam2_00770 [Chlamydiae bacterium]|nr:hypothetical protein [Chlamydiota bacterium]
MSESGLISKKRQKDWTHLTIQKSIQSLLPNAKLEERFPMIKRVADVVLFSEKIIFEIQCSLISLEEVQSRNRDYASLGYTVIWILHHQKFNREIVSPAELYLRRRLSYFTSITRYGPGYFYDQLEFFNGLERIYKGPPLILESLLPRTLTRTPRTFPKSLKEKFSHTTLYLPGDLTDLLLKRPNSNWARVVEKSFTPSRIKKFLDLAHDFFLYLLYLTASRESSSDAHKPAAKKSREITPDRAQNRSPIL